MEGRIPQGFSYTMCNKRNCGGSGWVGGCKAKLAERAREEGRPSVCRSACFHDMRSHLSCRYPGLVNVYQEENM